MKILILIESLNINNHSGAIVGSNTINALQKNGHDITVLYPNMYGNIEPKWLENVKTIRFEREEEKWREKIIALFPKVRALPAYIFGFNLEGMRLIDSWKNATLKALENDKFDLIYVLGVGNVFAAHFAMANVKTDIPWIANIHDPYPMQHYPEPYKKPATILNEKQYKLFDEVLKKSTYVTFPSVRLMEWMIQFHETIKEKSFVLPHLEMCLKNLPDTPNDYKVVLDSDKFNFLHIGSLLGTRNPEYFLKAFIRFLKEDPERKKKCVINIIGSNAKKYFNEEISEIFKDNINLEPIRVSYKHSYELLRQADVLILLEAIAKDSPFMPGKLADYITVDKPILALTPKSSETTRLLGSDYPYVAQAGHEEKIYHILVKLWKEWKNNKSMSLNRPDLLEYISSKNANKILIKNIM